MSNNSAGATKAWCLLAGATLATLILAGCGSSGDEASATGAPTSAAATAPADDTALAISGVPASSINQGAKYAFVPTVASPSGTTLSFTIQNSPPWATFDAGTGTLAGTPGSADVGTYSNITISVSDGATSASLSSFSIAVDQIGTGTASVSWTIPTQNVDGSAITNLAGFHIHYGTAANALTQSVDIANSGIATYVVSNLSAATWFFAVTAYKSDGTESAMSNVGSKTIQ